MPRRIPSATPSANARRSFVRAGLLLLTGVAAACAPGPSTPGDSPNLLFVIFDTTRADHLSTYGYPVETSPNVDALAAGGLQFDAAWAQASLTPISAATMFTGTLPYRHGIRSLFMVGRQSLSPETPTLAELLTASGWNTGGFVSAAPMSKRYQLDRGFEVYDDEMGADADERKRRSIGNAYQRRSDLTTDAALDWLDEALNAPQPFALLVHYFDSHDATLVPPRAFLEQRVSFPLPENLDETSDLRNVRADKRRIELYDAEIAFMDQQFGRLLQALEDADADDETVVVFVADHGESLGAHDYWTHGLLYADQLRVPWILRGPGVPSGERSEQPVALVDLLPTLRDLLGFELPDGMQLDGASALTADPDVATREFYAEVHHAPNNNLGADSAMYSLTRGPWKYIHRPDAGNHELYDHATDPGELVNLYTPEHAIARALQASLLQRGAVRGTEPGDAALDPKLQAMLEDLGYF